MIADREIIYLGRNNTVDLRLKSYQGSSGVTYQDLSAVTKVEVTFGSGVTVSSASSPTLFSGTTSTTGALTLKFGSADLTPGSYKSKVIVYDTDNTSGVVWDTVPIVVRS